MDKSPRLQSRPDNIPGELDFSILEAKLLSSAPHAQPRSWNSDSPSEKQSSSDVLNLATEQWIDEFEPFSTSIYPQGLQKRFPDLCLSCIRRFISINSFEAFSKRPVPEAFTYVQGIKDLDDSAKSCRFCTEVWQHYYFLWSYESDEDWTKVKVELAPETGRGNRELRGIKICVHPLQKAHTAVPYTRHQEGHFWVHMSEGKRKHSSWILHADATQDDPAASKVSAREINNSVDSPTALRKAKNWIDTCGREHKSCRSPSPRDLPTRLLDVSEAKLRLRSTEGLDEAQYTALSYCWGGDHYQPNQLKGGPGGNLQHFLKGVPLSTFPQTLQDAIIITRELGVPFIWIDSACIIQNDEEDKRREIAKMRRIYANSHVTIIASTARTAADGFLQDREFPPCPIKVPFPCASGVVGSMDLRHKLHSGWTQHDVRSSHTDKRAWTMEEKLLSTRILMYTDKQLRWICNTTRDCDGGHIESYQDDVVIDPDRVLYVNLNVNPDRLDDYMQLSSSLAIDEHEKFKDVWGILVTCYTRRSVTNVKDRLRAIGGIAEAFSRQTGYRYLAGLWRETLAYNLLYKESNPIDISPPEWDMSRHEDPSFFQKQIKRPTAPTWSWASGHYEITSWMYGRIDFVDFSIVHCSVMLQSEHRPYGDVLSGELILRGRILPAYILDSHVIQIRGPPNPRNGQPTWPTVGTANLDPFRPNAVGQSRQAKQGCRQEVLLLNFGTFNDGNESVGLVLSPAVESTATAEGKSHTRMGLYTAWGFRVSDFKYWSTDEVRII